MMTKLKEFWKHLVKGEMREAGVTLIELLIAVAIMAVIAVVAVPAVTGALNNSKINVTEQNMATIADALTRYAADHNGSYPSDLSGLTTTYLATIPNDGYGNGEVATGAGWIYSTAANGSAPFTLTDKENGNTFSWGGSSVLINNNSTVSNS